MPFFTASIVENNIITKCVIVDTIDVGKAILLEWIAEDEIVITPEIANFIENDSEYTDESTIGTLKTYQISLAE